MLISDRILTNRRKDHREMTMNVPKLLLSLGFAAFFAVGIGHAQGIVLMQQEWVSASQTLAGHATIGTINVPANGIKVELCSPNWQTGLASTTTDRNGYFSLDTPKSGKLFYVRLSAPEVNPYQLRVRLKKNAPKELTIHLKNST
jgi:hypothetical protein